MTRWNIVLVLSAGALVAACGQQRANDKPVDQTAPQSQNAPAALPQGSTAAAPLSNVQAGNAPPEYVQPGPDGTVTAAPAPSTAHRAPAHREPAHAQGTVAARRQPAARREAGTSTAQARPEPRSEPVERIGRDGEPRTGEVRDDDTRTVDRSTVLPAGTELTLVLETPVSSDTSRVGDAVTARVERAVGEDGKVALPGGAVLHGRVARVQEAGRVSGRAHVAVAFDRITVRGEDHRLTTSEITAEGPESHGRDAKIIGGSTAAGAVIGGILGGGKGAKRGALVGVLGGGTAVLVNKGREVQLPSGARYVVRVRNTVRL